MKPGSSETLSRLEGGCYVPTLGTYDTSATTAWYTLIPIRVINNRPPAKSKRSCITLEGISTTLRPAHTEDICVELGYLCKLYKPRN